MEMNKGKEKQKALFFVSASNFFFTSRCSAACLLPVAEKGLFEQLKTLQMKLMIWVHLA